MSDTFFLSPLDWLALGVLLISLLVGYMRGFLTEAVSAASWVCAFFAARSLGPTLAQLLPLQAHSPGLGLLAGMAIVFVLVVFLGGFVAWLLSRAAEAAGLRIANRGLGALFGGLRALAIVVMLVWLGGQTALGKTEGWRQSFSLQVASGFLPLLPETWAQAPGAQQISDWLRQAVQPPAASPAALPVVSPDSLPALSPSLDPLPAPLPEPAQAAAPIAPAEVIPER